MVIDSSTEIQAADRYFTTHEVADILGVTASSVVKWINAGFLEAFRTPGGHRRISAVQLVRFSMQQGMPVPEALADLAVGKVLAIDDEASFLAALKKTFKLHDDEFSLETSANGIEGLLRVGGYKPDLLILGVGMKGLNAFEVLKRLHANPETARVVVIAVGARMDEATSAKCTKLGAALCLKKPVDVPALVETLRSLRKLGHRR